jgi:hypothetical protein
MCTPKNILPFIRRALKLENHILNCQTNLLRSHPRDHDKLDQLLILFFFNGFDFFNINIYFTHNVSRSLNL